MAKKKGKRKRKKKLRRRPIKVDKLPNAKDVKVGEKFKVRTEIKGKQRDLTIKRVTKHGKKRNLPWQIIKNKRVKRPKK